MVNFAILGLIVYMAIAAQAIRIGYISAPTLRVTFKC